MAVATKAYKKGAEVSSVGEDEVDTYTFIVEVDAQSEQEAKYGLDSALQTEVDSENGYINKARAFTAV